MYSVKPGRGPSLMGGVAGIFLAIFGVVWTVVALSAGAPILFGLFGLVFVGLAISGVVYNFYNATQPDRMSEVDVTVPGEEPDPLAQAMGHERPASGAQRREGQDIRQFAGDFCPFCGAKVQADFDFCPKCGKNI